MYVDILQNQVKRCNGGQEMQEAKYADKTMRSYFRWMSEINATQDFKHQGELGRELERDLIEAYSPEGDILERNLKPLPCGNIRNRRREHALHR